MSSIAENVKSIKQRVAEAAVRSGRAPEDVRLCAATKMNDAARVKEAVAAGVDCCGENRVQREDGWCKSFPAVAEVVSELFLGSAVHCVGTEKRVFPLLNSNRQFV